MGFPVSSTFADMVDECRLLLQGWGSDNDQVGTLTSSIESTDLLIPVEPGVTQGLIEIDSELIWVQSVDSGVASIPPWGRGFKRTTATSHTAGAMVSIAPAYPSAVVARELRNSISRVYPDLFAVSSVVTTITDSKYEVTMPANLGRVLSVGWRFTSAHPWIPLRHWELQAAPATGSNPVLYVGLGVGQNASLHVVYAHRPTIPTADTDTFISTGLPESAQDVVILGAAERLLPWMDAAAIPSRTVPSDTTDRQIPAGTAVTVGRDLRQRYAQRLATESASLKAKYPTRAHKVR